MSQPERLTRQQRRALERTGKKERSPFNNLKGPNLSIDNQLIISQARKRKVSPNRSEQELWRHFMQFPLERPLPHDYVEASWKKIEQAIDLMSQSRNPIFKEDATFLKNLLAQDGLVVNIVPSLEVPGTLGGSIGTAVGDVEGKPMPGLLVSAGSILNSESGLMLGFHLTHEAVHLRHRLQDIEGLGLGIPSDEAVTDINSRAVTIESLLPEEARAYGRQSEAVIHQYGLGQWPIRGDIVETAAAYIRGGENPDSTRWHNYVRTEILTYVE